MVFWVNSGDIFERANRLWQEGMCGGHGRTGNAPSCDLSDRCTGSHITNAHYLKSTHSSECVCVCFTKFFLKEKGLETFPLVHFLKSIIKCLMR
jgi:hypothetical protein